MRNKQTDRNPILSTYSAIAALLKVRKELHEELREFRERFCAASEVPKHAGASLGRQLTTATDDIPTEYHKTKRAVADVRTIAKTENKSLNKVLALALHSRPTRFEIKSCQSTWRTTS